MNQPVKSIITTKRACVFLKYNGIIMSNMLRAVKYKFHEKGFSLFEILIAIAVFATMGLAAAQLISVSLQADKAGGQKTVGAKLVSEEMEAVNAIATEQWNNIYALNKGSANHYYAVVSSGKWATSTGNELITANDLEYTRYFYAENTCRDATTKNIKGITDSNGMAETCVGVGGNHDPSTQKITTIATWKQAGGNTLGTTTQSAFLTRSRNAATAQSDWATGAGQATNPSSGEDANFNGGFSSQDGNIDIFQSGIIKLNQ